MFQRLISSLAKGDFADQPGAGLQLSGGDLLAHSIGAALDQNLARNPAPRILPSKFATRVGSKAVSTNVTKERVALGPV
jgi:hypothetical protein